MLNTPCTIIYETILQFYSLNGISFDNNRLYGIEILISSFVTCLSKTPGDIDGILSFTLDLNSKQLPKCNLAMCKALM